MSSWERKNYKQYIETEREKGVAREAQEHRNWMNQLLRASKLPQPPPWIPIGGSTQTPPGPLIIDPPRGSQWTITHIWIGLTLWVPISAVLYFKASVPVGISLLLGFIIGAILGRYYQVSIFLGILYAAYEIAIRFQ